MRRLIKTTYIFLGFSLLNGQSNHPTEKIIKEFTPAGRIEALVDEGNSIDLLLVQLDLKNDSLFNLVSDIFPDMELFSGPASYHRIMNHHHLKQIQRVLTDEYYFILIENYNLPNYKF